MSIIKATTINTFDPQFGFNTIPAGTTLSLYATSYSNYKYYILGRDFAAIGYPVTELDMERLFGRYWKKLPAFN